MQEIIYEKAKTLVRLLTEHEMTITFAESCTGGLCAADLTRVNGASGVFKGSAVTYSEEIKSALVGVSDKTLEEYGVYSKECAKEMSAGARRLFGADIALALTGIAGPSGATKTDPVGTVYISLDSSNFNICKRFVFDGDRDRVRSLATLAAYEMAIAYLADVKGEKSENKFSDNHFVVSVP